MRKALGIFKGKCFVAMMLLVMLALTNVCTLKAHAVEFGNRDVSEA